MIEQKLIRKLKNITAIFGIVGLGYVGLPLALRFTEIDFNVIDFDVDLSKIKALEAGRSYIKHIPLSGTYEYLGNKGAIVTYSDPYVP